LLVSWVCGERYFVAGLAIGLVVLAAAGAVGLGILLGAPLVLDDDRPMHLPRNQRERS
jgi:hypothetical protein